MYCSESFDTNIEAYGLIKNNSGNSGRYVHKKCIKDFLEKYPDKKSRLIEVQENEDLCFYCKQIINDTDEIKEFKDGFIAHKKCWTDYLNRENLTELEQLNLYILSLYSLTSLPPNIVKQIDEYKEKYNYTYSGMLKSLKYWYEILKKPIIDNITIGIIPYIYGQAKEYYYKIYIANKKNKDKTILEKTTKIELDLSCKKRRNRHTSFFEEDD